MNDNTQRQMTLEESKPDTMKAQLFEEVPDLARNAIDCLLPQIVECLEQQKHHPGEAPHLNRLAHIRDTLKNVHAELDALIQIEVEAVALRNSLEQQALDQVEKNQ